MTYILFLRGVPFKRLIVSKESAIAWADGSGESHISNRDAINRLHDWHRLVETSSTEWKIEDFNP